MYCNNCGKQNPKESKFCQSCGEKFVRVLDENKVIKTTNEVKPSEAVNEEEPNKEKVKAGLGGWLTVVGIALILNPFQYGYNLLGYFPLFNNTYEIPGFMTLLQLEFVCLLALFVVSIYLLYLYFKKSIKFPKYYVIFLIATVIYVSLDYLILSSLSAPTAEQQKIITDSVTQNSSAVGRQIFFAIIWVSYMMKSKRVKATFINK